MLLLSGCASPNSTYVRIKDFQGDMNLTEKTPLMRAAETGDLKKVKEFISMGAKVNDKNEIINSMSPLHYATTNNKIQIVKVLIENGADVNALTDIMWTPLHYASFNGNIESASILISNGANVNSRDAELLTPLHYAVINNHKDIASLLVNNGAIIHPNNETAEYSETSAKCFKIAAENCILLKKTNDLISDNFGLAAKQFEIASRQYKANANSSLTKESILIGANVIMSLASISLAAQKASMEAKMQAKQNALIDAMRSSDGKGQGKGYGSAQYFMVFQSPLSERYGNLRRYYSELSEICSQVSFECHEEAKKYKSKIN